MLVDKNDNKMMSDITDECWRRLSVLTERHVRWCGSLNLSTQKNYDDDYDYVLVF